MSDEELIAAVAAGEHTALKHLYERHALWIAGRLRRTLPAGAVEDVVQETFIAIWCGAKTFNADGVAGAWIWGIARRQAASWLRKHGRPDPAWVPPDQPDLSTLAANAVDLERALSTLTNEQRELARLAMVEGQPVAEVARRLNIPQGTVKSRVHRVRRLLRKALGYEDGGS